MSSVRRLPSGKWQAQFRPVPNGPQVTKTSPLKGVVEEWLRQQTAAIVTGTYVNAKSGRLTFRAYFESWAPRQIWEANTARSMDIAMRSTTFADKPLRSIERADLELWVKAMQTKARGPKGDPTGRGLAASTIATRFANVRTVFRAAMADKRIGSDPTLGVRLPKKRRREAALRIPTVEYVRRWLNAADPQYRALIAVCAFAGLRLGEAAGLRVSDIHFTKRTIDVRRQVQRGPGGVLEIRPPKHGSERTVAAPSGLLTILGAHVALLGLQGDPDAWLFPGEGGNPAHANTIGYAWRKARSAAGGSDYVLHDLRHFFASGLIAANCDVSTVQHAMGHSSAAITLSTYTHLWPKAEDRTRAASQGLVDAVLGATDESVTNESAGSA